MAGLGPGQGQSGRGFGADAEGVQRLAGALGHEDGVLPGKGDRAAVGQAFELNGETRKRARVGAQRVQASVRRGGEEFVDAVTVEIHCQRGTHQAFGEGHGEALARLALRVEDVQSAIRRRHDDAPPDAIRQPRQRRAILEARAGVDRETWTLRAVEIRRVDFEVLRGKGDREPPLALDIGQRGLGADQIAGGLGKARDHRAVGKNGVEPTVFAAPEENAPVALAPKPPGDGTRHGRAQAPGKAGQRAAAGVQGVQLARGVGKDEVGPPVAVEVGQGQRRRSARLACAWEREEFRTVVAKGAQRSVGQKHRDFLAAVRVEVGDGRRADDGCVLAEREGKPRAVSARGRHAEERSAARRGHGEVEARHAAEVAQRDGAGDERRQLERKSRGVLSRARMGSEKERHKGERHAQCLRPPG